MNFKDFLYKTDIDEAKLENLRNTSKESLQKIFDLKLKYNGEEIDAVWLEKGRTKEGGTQYYKYDKLVSGDLETILKDEKIDFQAKESSSYATFKNYIIISDNVRYMFSASGGQTGKKSGVKGKSSGALFEDLIYKYINMKLNSEAIGNKSHNKSINDLFNMVESRFGSKIIGASADGALNQSRKLLFTGKTINSESFDIGKIVTDITLFLENGKNVYLSLKLTKSYKLLNYGIGKVVPAEEVLANKITSPQALKFLKTFGLEPDLFCDVFTAIKDGRKKITPTEPIPFSGKFNVLQKFIAYSVGHGYYMIHAESLKDEINIYDFYDTKNLTKLLKFKPKNCFVYYGNPDSATISIGINVEDTIDGAVHQFRLVIRNRSSRTKGYPVSMDVNYTKSKNLKKDISKEADKADKLS